MTEKGKCEVKSNFHPTANGEGGEGRESVRERYGMDVGRTEGGV
jgi:hypothetical protein